MKCTLLTLVLTVEAEHEAPNLVMFPSATLTLLPQTSTLLDCVATGYPPPTISWLKDGLLVNSSFSDSLTLLVRRTFSNVAMVTLVHAPTLDERIPPSVGSFSE